MNGQSIKPSRLYCQLMVCLAGAAAIFIITLAKRITSKQRLAAGDQAYPPAPPAVL